MAAPSLFAATSSGPQPLIEFKAGKLTTSEKPGGKFLVAAEKEKGVVKLFPKGADQMVHLTWSTRTNNTVVHDLVIFPGDQLFEKVLPALCFVY